MIRATLLRLSSVHALSLKSKDLPRRLTRPKRVTLWDGPFKSQLQPFGVS